MYRYFAKQKSCILKLFYINIVYNLLYIFRLLIRSRWWLITSLYDSSPKSFMRPLIIIFTGGGRVVPDVFNLFNKAFIQIKLDYLILLPHPLYRFTMNFVSSCQTRHCKVGRPYTLCLWKQSHFPSNEKNFDINISDCIRNYTCSN